MRAPDVLSGIALVVVLCACGAGPAQDEPAVDEVIAGLPDGCPGCTATEPAAYTAQPPVDLRVYPPSLMFYGDLSTQGSLAPQVLTVANHTSSTTLITDIIIADQTGAGTADGSEYFRFDMPPIEHPLGRGDELSFEVSFVRSSEQRDAVLTIRTTHSSYPELTVDLSGKYFLW